MFYWCFFSIGALFTCGVIIPTIIKDSVRMYCDYLMILVTIAIGVLYGVGFAIVWATRIVGKSVPRMPFYQRLKMWLHWRYQNAVLEAARARARKRQAIG